MDEYEVVFETDARGLSVAELFPPFTFVNLVKIIGVERVFSPFVVDADSVGHRYHNFDNMDSKVIGRVWFVMLSISFSYLWL